MEVGISRVPRSQEYPSGIRYRFQYVDRSGVARLRYDNAHGEHERHAGPEAPGTPIEYPGDIWEHLRQFFAEVERIRED